MNNKWFKLILLFLCFKSAIAQKDKDSLFLGFHFKWKTENLELHKNYFSNKDTLQINVLKFYISEIEINYTDGENYKEKNSYHLIDFENVKTQKIAISRYKNKPILKVKFNVGIDSTASVSGALSGDLDLQKGMYWAWQSGYINMKIEGKSNSCKTRKNQFQFHIGGFMEPNYSLREINLNGNFNDKNQINVVMDLEKLFAKIDLKETNTIMIPSEKAMQFADITAKIFFLE